MNKKNAATILALILIGAFFLPYLSGSGESISGFKIVFGKGGLFGATKGTLMFLILLIPLGAILALIGSLGVDSSPNSGIVVWMPLIGTAYLAVRLYFELRKVVDVLGGGSLDVSRFVSVLGYGFWITLVASILLLLNSNRSD